MIAAVLLVVLLAVASAYGFHRDEMYFILAGRHPDFGYVDQPPLTPLLSALMAQLLGTSPLAVRVLPAVVAAVGLLVCADMARRLGAGPRAQSLAAVLLAISGWMGAGHLDATATYDILLWMLTCWLMIQLLASPRPAGEWGRWIALGLVMGIALENKTLPVFLGISLAVGVLACRRWDIVRSPGLWIAVAIAAGLWASNLAWQAAHGFPQLEMAQHIASQSSGLGNRLKELGILVLLAGPLVFPVALAGVAWLLRSPESRAWRPLGMAVLVNVGLMVLTAGKSYYSAGFLGLAIAGGSVVLDRWLGRSVARWSAFAPAAAASGAVFALVLLPLVPAAQLHATPIPDLYQESVAQVGWPELAAQMHGIVAAMPADERAHAAILAPFYGSYGALEIYGQDLPVYSGHNSVWYWGRPADDVTTVVLPDWSLPWARAYFTECHVAGRIDNGLDAPTQEQGGTIFICHVPEPWSTLWPDLYHVD